MRCVSLNSYFILPLLVILLGCALVSPPPALIPALEATAQAAPSATPTATPTTSPAVLACPARQSVPYPARPATFAEYPEAVRNYLAAGGSPATLDDVLASWDVMPAEGAADLHADLTGDAVPETGVLFVNPDSATYPPEAALVLYTCQEKTVRILYNYQPGEWFGLNLIGAQDLTQDGRADLVFSDVTCGAHTCWHEVHVWSWQGVDFTDQVGAAFTFPYPAFALNEGRLLVQSGGIGSVGAGPQRPVTTTLAWTGSVVTATETQPGPATFRYHAFLDGDAALFTGNYGRARKAYERVLTNDDLDAWAAFFSADEERAWLDALARWRLLFIAAQLDEPATAEAHYTELAARTPPNVPGYDVVIFAQHFWATYQSTGNVDRACQDAQRTQVAEELLNFLNGFGYANPLYERAALCPIP